MGSGIDVESGVAIYSNQAFKDENLTDQQNTEKEKKAQDWQVDRWPKECDSKVIQEKVI